MTPAPAQQEKTKASERKAKIFEKAKQLGKVAVLAAFTSFMQTEASAQARDLENKELHLPKMEMTPQQIKAALSEKPQTIVVSDESLKTNYVWHPGEDFDTLTIHTEKSGNQEEIIFNNKTHGFTVYEGFTGDEIPFPHKNATDKDMELTHSAGPSMAVVDYASFDGKNKLQNNWTLYGDLQFKGSTENAAEEGSVEFASSVLQDVIDALKVHTANKGS